MNAEQSGSDRSPLALKPSPRPFHDASVRQHLLERLLEASIVLPEDWQALPESTQAELRAQPDSKQLLEQLVEMNLLTRYQAARLGAGRLFGLVFGNYRVLERLASGGMGIIYKAEHVRMRRLVAIKVLQVPRDQHTRMLARFDAEMRAIAKLQHPNVVGLLDAGQELSSDPDAPVLHYLVMEYIAGEDLESYVQAHGPLPPAEACDLICQIASALDETDKHHLIHRDIKPSNIMVTPDRQAKLLDFGLVHHFRNRLTEPQTTMGTVDYMPPEQARDAGKVDIRADIYSLGGTLFWCLTGTLPFPPRGNVTQELIERQTQPPPSPRLRRSEVPAELDAVVLRMMATQPDDRYRTPAAVLRALLPFRQRDSGGSFINLARTSTASIALPPENATPQQHVHQILIVDDEREIRDICRFAFQSDGLLCEQAENGPLALEVVEKKPFDLVLLDIDMPEMSGREVLRQLRAKPPVPNLKIIMFSGRASSDEMAQMLSSGADDYLTKPFSLVQLLARVKAALRLKEAQDRSELLQRHLLTVNAQLEQNLTARDSDYLHARNALVLALAKLIEHRAIETSGHLKRMQYYCQCLAEQASVFAGFSGQIDHNFIQMLECCVPLHDIGKVALPDHILLKPGKLDTEEHIIMQSHTTIGADTLTEIAQQHGSALAFLHMAIDIVRHHHERYDGHGYPDRLSGGAIPLAARIVTLADTYDALRSRAVGRPPLSHNDALQVIAESPGQFDPLLLQAFERCAPQFERVFREVPD
jgi:response regulator RpfG family c-di-GMP phosphodiesterase/serine/threonine protein kinase